MAKVAKELKWKKVHGKGKSVKLRDGRVIAYGEEFVSKKSNIPEGFLNVFERLRD